MSPTRGPDRDGPGEGFPRRASRRASPLPRNRSRAHGSGRHVRLLALALLSLAAACVSVPATGGGPESPSTTSPAGNVGAGPAQGAATVPPGYGTLHQDQFTVNLRSGSLLVKVTPLAETVIRLAAPDTYARLHALSQQWLARARQAAAGDTPQLFLVSFFSYDPDIPYQPEDLLITHQGRLLHPAAIFPMTPGWGRQRLDQQQVESAVYVFTGAFNYELPLTVRYELQQSNDWTQIVPILDAERARVRARAPSGG